MVLANLNELKISHGFTRSDPLDYQGANVGVSVKSALGVMLCAERKSELLTSADSSPCALRATKKSFQLCF